MPPLADITALLMALAALVAAISGLVLGVLNWLSNRKTHEVATAARGAADVAQSKADTAHAVAEDARKSAGYAGRDAALNTGAVTSAVREAGSHADDIRSIVSTVAGLAAMITPPGQSAAPLGRPQVPSTTSK